MIELGDGWVLGADAMQYMLGRHVKTPSKKKAVRWWFFFPDLASALEHFAELAEIAKIGGCKAAQALEAAELVKQVHEETRRLIQACARDMEMHRGALAEEGGE